LRTAIFIGVSWPRRLPAHTCPECSGPLVNDHAATHPVHTWVVVPEQSPDVWDHHRSRPDGTGAGAGDRFECERCGRIAMFG
jgi:hypothetical protein